MSATVSQLRLYLVQLAATHQKALEVLFTCVAADATAAHFHPHPFTSGEAERICRQAGKDLYFGVLRNHALVGYGMLRGWNEGFSVPSLGIYVTPEVRATGVARTLMQHLHESAKQVGAKQIRLKVHIDNIAARQLYLSLGYRFEGLPQADGQLLGFFDIASE